MSLPSNELPPQLPPDAPDELRARWHCREAGRLARLAVEEGWLAGHALRKVREKCGRVPNGALGGFRGWLQASKISRSSAYRFMELSENLTADELGKHETIASALRLIASRRPKDPGLARALEVWPEFRDRVDDPKWNLLLTKYGEYYKAIGTGDASQAEFGWTIGVEWFLQDELGGAPDGGD